MARGRMLSKDASTDPDLNSLSMEAELLYLLTIPHLDRDGLVAGDPVLVWASAAPKRIELLDKAPRLINEWIERGLVIRYDWKDGSILWFKGFRRHNSRLPYGEEPESRFPPPPGWTRYPEGLIPDDPEVCEREAVYFDKRNTYAQALKKAVSRPSSQEELQTLRRKSAESPQKVRREEKLNIIKDQDQSNNDDDVGLSPDETTDDDDSFALREAMEDLSIEWAETIREWTGPEKHINTLDYSGLLSLLSWLYLYRQLKNPDPYEQMVAAERYSDVFEGVKNPVGKIIKQSTLGNMAALHEQDIEELKAIIREYTQSPAAEI